MSKIGLYLTFILSIATVVNSATIDSYFVNQSYGARILSMGEAASALQDNPENVYVNPAANGFVESLRFSSSYNDYYASSFRQASLSAVLPVSGYGVLSFALPIKIISDIPLTGEQSGEFLKTGTIENNAVAGYVSFAKLFTESLAVGATVKMVKEHLYMNNAVGVGYDVGVSYKNNNSLMDVGLALSVLDVGDTALAWDTSSRHVDSLPMTTRLGASLSKSILDSRITMAIDLVSRETSSYTAMGLELQSNGLSLRAGLNNHSGTSLASCGLGLQLGCISFDYGIKSDEIMGQVSKFTTGITL